MEYILQIAEDPNGKIEELGFEIDEQYELFLEDQLSETPTVLNGNSEKINLNTLIQSGAFFTIN